MSENTANGSAQRFTGERIVWTNPNDHLKEFGMVINWYLQALPYAFNNRVIDVACGTGLGSFLLSTTAADVTAIDIQDQDHEWAPLVAAAATADKNLRFMVMDLEKEPVDMTADLAVSIETIEHLANPEFFLSNLKAKSLFFTVPCYGNKNEFHKIEYTEASLKELIEKHYGTIEHYEMPGRRMVGIAKKYDSN